MHKIVHRHEPTPGSCQVLVAVPAVDQNGRVVVPVQEDELLFAQHNKQSVNKLWQLAQHKHERPEAGYAVSVAVVAHAVDHAVLKQGPKEIGPHANCARDAEHGQDDVPRDEERAQLVLGSALHVVLAAEYEKDVGERGGDADPPVVGHPSGPVLGVFFVVEERLVAVCVFVCLVGVELSIYRFDVEHWGCI